MTEVYNGLETYLGQGQANALQSYGNQSSLSSGYVGQSIYPYSYYQPVVQEREPHAWEFKIERNGDSVRMDYGAELRLLIADPIRGIDIREAVQKLKSALLKYG